MFSFFKRDKNNPNVPRWASFFSDEQYKSFLNAIEVYFRKKGHRYSIDQWGRLTVTADDFGFKYIFTTYAAEACKKDKIKNYERIVARYFDDWVKSDKDSFIRRNIHDYSKVREYITLLFQPGNYFFGTDKEAILLMPVAGDAWFVLNFDTPSWFGFPVTEEATSGWNKSKEELFSEGIANVRKKYPSKILQKKFLGFKCWLCEASHQYVANIILNLQEYPQLIGSKGSLIGVPTVHMVLIYPIENAEVSEVLKKMIRAIHTLNREGPMGCSNIFWYTEGRFINLPYSMENSRMQFFPPADFSELLNSLRK
jgi:hypothetical protein